MDTVSAQLRQELEALRAAGLYKEERVLDSPQGAEITVGGRTVLNFCANNYLGLSSHPKVLEAARRGLEQWGYGLSSVRFICGTQRVHKDLEAALARFFHTDDTILYAACFDANGGIFEPLLGEQDAIVSDSLNHASIIDGVRLCKAMRYRYEHASLADLEAKLNEARNAGARHVLIATDGAFSMDGDVAPLAGICDLAEQHRALVMVDDCHGSGFLGKTGRGSLEHAGVLGRVDIVTGTLGKALGGASGGFTTGRAAIIELLRQRSRPYLFSNTLAPSIAAASIAVLDLISESTELRDRLERNTRRFRAAMTQAGFDIKPGEHPIVPIMLYEEKLAHEFARRLLDEGIYVIGFSYPVVAKGQARIRVQLSAAHAEEHVDRAVAAFAKVGKDLGVLAGRG